MKKLTFLLLFCGIFNFSQIIAQTNYYLQNGLVIADQNGTLLDITRGDSLRILKNYILIKYSLGTTDPQIAIIESDHNLDRRYSCSTGWIIYHVPDTNSIMNLVESLLSQIDSSTLSFNYPMTYYSSTPNDPEYQNLNQWYIDKIKVPEAWDITTGNSEIKVGVLDQGVDWGNPDFEPNNLGWNFASDPSNSNVYPTDWMHNHGNMITAIIAAKTNNSIGSSGIAGGWNSSPVKIVMYKIPDNFSLDMAECAAALDYGLNQGIKLFNFSWGIPDPGCSCSYALPLKASIDQAYDYYGATMFASAGNGESEVVWPACNDKVISVGATNANDYRWDEGSSPNFSSFGINTDISAPGDNILFPAVYGDPGSPYQFAHGTSCSSPIAVGVAALMLSVNPCLSNVDIQDILQTTADKTGGYPYDWDVTRPGHSQELGYGRINAYNAVLKASDPRIEIVSNTTINEPTWFTHNLRILPGNTLTITSTVKFTEGVKIIVEPGAELRIDGGILTSTCTGFWGGIEVLGNRYLAQTPTSNQGYVRIYNGGLIENAYEGIYAHDGGLVIGLDATFRNNMRGVLISNYQGTNLSLFNRCIFEFANVPGYNHGNPLFTGNQFLLGAEMVKPIRVNGCIFRNRININSMPFNQRGYGILAANAEILVSDASVIVNGQEQKIKSSFTNFNYGLYAQRSGNQYVISIDNSTFIDNLRGLYIGGYNGTSYARVVCSTIKALPPSSFPGYTTYGMYLNFCSEYTVENNEFYNSPVIPEGIGLIINNSGPYDNTIYNNQFHKLEYGVLAQRCNRISDQKGLCFRCNDFYNNLNDIAITSDAPSGTPDQGIAIYQGNKTIPAKNTFTVESNVFDINNPFDQITYNHDETYGNCIVIPLPTIGVLSKPAFGSTYNKVIDCPSHCAGDPDIDEVILNLNEANQKADSLSDILNLLVDGGSTDLLVEDVNTSLPTQSVEVYDQLLQESPFLSDSVMKTAINKETVLPNVMIRDILVANPQSAKSSDVLAVVDQRVVPMPDSLKAQILEGLSVTGAKEELSASISGWKQQYLNSYKELIRIYTEDTTRNNGFDSTVSLLNSQNSLESRYDLATLYFGKSMYSEGFSVLNAIPLQFNLGEKETENHNKFVALSSIMEQITTDSTGLKSLDSLQIITLNGLAGDESCLSGVYARNLLSMSGHLQYSEPIILPGSFALSGWSRNFTPGKFAREPYLLTVFPNPASSYFIVEYGINTVIPQGTRISVTVTSLTGRQLKVVEGAKLYDQIIIKTQDLQAGTYLVTLNIGSETIRSEKVILIK